MRALLTGSTGNLGHEVMFELLKRSVEVVPLVRKGRMESFPAGRFETPVIADLLEAEPILYDGTVDCIVHCAGDVRFKDAGDNNRRMMEQILRFARARQTPVHFVSTAFVYRPEGSVAGFTNAYEEDKLGAEEMLKASGLPHSILRPSVITGTTSTGVLKNYTGYYLIVNAFRTAVQTARAHGRKLRFPAMHGLSDMVPVDQVAFHVVDAVIGEETGLRYITNPEPPLASFVLAKTLAFLEFTDTVDVVDISFEEFGGLSHTEEEALLYRFANNFQRYWSQDYRFPASVCTENRIDERYLRRTLTAFLQDEHTRHA